MPKATSRTNAATCVKGTSSTSKDQATGNSSKAKATCSKEPMSKSQQRLRNHQLQRQAQAKKAGARPPSATRPRREEEDRRGAEGQKQVNLDPEKFCQLFDTFPSTIYAEFKGLPRLSSSKRRLKANKGCFFETTQRTLTNLNKHISHGLIFASSRWCCIGSSSGSWCVKKKG